MLFDASGIQLGRVDALDEEVNYDPWPLAVGETTYWPPAGLAFLNVVAIEITAINADTIEATLTFEQDQHAELTLKLIGEGNLRATLIPTADEHAIAYFRLRPTVDTQEGFYGLGEYFDQVNHRGKIRAMQMEADLSLEGGYNEAHVPIPFIIGTTGWGLFADCPYPGTFDVATQTDDRVEITFGTGPFSMAGFTFYLFAADHPLDITKHYYETTGYPNLPGRFGLGPLVWRDENDDQAQVESDLATLRELDLATSAYWIDRPYASGVNGFDFHSGMFSNAQDMIDLAHAYGFRMALWHSPYVASGHESSDATIALYDEAVANGYFPPQTGLLLNKWGKPIDFTNPDAYAWWQNLIHRYTDMGIEGFKLDYAEDVVPGLFGVRNMWEFDDGSDERSMHSLYQLGYHRVYAETMPETGGFILARGGTYGDQTNVNVIWPGDLDADFSYHGQIVEKDDDETYGAVGGVPAALIGGLTLGPSGFPFYGSDTGGYRHSPPDKETFTRWFQITALSTVMQIGTSSNDVAWEYDSDNGFDDEMLGWYRTYTRLHLRLFPYEWTYAKNLATDGRAIQRPLGLTYPDLGEHPSDIFLFGDYLLVAPVVERSQTQKDVRFPPGRWVDWWDGTLYEGDRTETVEAPLSKLPLYLMEGGIVPMLRPTIDTISPTTQDAELVDSFDTHAGILYARIVPGAASTFTLYDGTVISQEKSDTSVALSYSDGEEFSFGAQFELIAFGDTAPSSVTDNGAALSQQASLDDLSAGNEGWIFIADQLGGLLVVKVGAGEHSVEVVF